MKLEIQFRIKSRLYSAKYKSDILKNSKNLSIERQEDYKYECVVIIDGVRPSISGGSDGKKNVPALLETRGSIPGWKDPLER